MSIHLHTGDDVTWGKQIAAGEVNYEVDIGGFWGREREEQSVAMFSFTRGKHMAVRQGS